jgi:hypothetical protein
MKKASLIISFFIFFITTAFAAAPVVHIYCAELYFKHCKPTYTAKEKAAFIRGTLFPDIRYVARIPRTQTHSKNVLLKDVQALKDPFLAGKLFHSYVDEQREKIAKKERIYEHITVDKKHKSRFVKAVEDELCFDKIDAKKAIAALKEFDSHENKAGIPVFIVMGWHRVLQDYLKQSPMALMKKKAKTKSGYFNMTPAMVREASTQMEKYCKDKKVKNYFEAFIKDFETNLKKK